MAHEDKQCLRSSDSTCVYEKNYKSFKTTYSYHFGFKSRVRQGSYIYKGETVLHYTKVVMTDKAISLTLEAALWMYWSFVTAFE